MRRRRREWPGLVALWEASGESAAEFARRLGVNAETLGRWKRAVGASPRELHRPALAKIVELQPTAPPVDHRFEVRLAGGRCVCVPPSFDGPALERLLRVLEAVS